MKPIVRSPSSGSDAARGLKVAAGLAGFVGLGFGLPGAVGLKHFAETGEVWMFMGFPTYGGGPFERVGVRTSVPLMSAFIALCAAEVATGCLLWRGSRAGVRLSHALLPIEMAFWIGFALPVGPPLGVARALLVIRQRHMNASQSL